MVLHVVAGFAVELHLAVLAGQRQVGGRESIHLPAEGRHLVVVAQDDGQWQAQAVGVVEGHPDVANAPARLLDGAERVVGGGQQWQGALELRAEQVPAHEVDELRHARQQRGFERDDVAAGEIGVHERIGNRRAGEQKLIVKRLEIGQGDGGVPPEDHARESQGAGGGQGGVDLAPMGQEGLRGRDEGGRSGNRHG